MGFGQGLSGLNAAAQELDVIGNNIANSGTVGFKSSSAAFADVYANSKVGLGTKVSSVNQRFTVGTISATGNQFDMAIDGAKGMFRVQDASGNILYTRNGQFHANKDNYIVNAQGHRLTGYALNGTDLVPIQVPVGNIPPRATDSMTTKTNLDANAPVIHTASVPQTPGTIVLTDSGTPPATQAYNYTVNANGDVVWSGTAPDDGEYTSADGSTVTIAATTPLAASGLPAQGAGETAFVPAIVGHPFDPNDAQSFTHSLPISVYDSLGNAHQLTQYFVKRESATPGESTWEVYYRLNGQELDSHPDGSPAELRFSSGGLLLSGGTQTLSFANPGGVNSPANDLSINVSYGGSTQFGGDFSPNFTQTGFPTGEYAGMSIAADGAIVANYTNGETQAMGYIALADFNNLQGLQPVGGNAWVETGASGGPVVGRPGSNGLATLQGQSVEESNVDMSQELVNMIIAQRTYQANAQTIKTQDQVLQTLITMR